MEVAESVDPMYTLTQEGLTLAEAIEQAKRMLTGWGDMPNHSTPPCVLEMRRRGIKC